MPSSKVMHKFKEGKLHSGSKHGPKVKSRDQAIAIMMSEQRAEKSHGGHYPEKVGGLGSFHGTSKPKEKSKSFAKALNRRR